jgi:hypothetical protein
MDKIYILAGIEGMPITNDKNIFTIDRIVARDILSGDDDRFTFDEIVDNDIEIFGLPSWFLDNYCDLNSIHYNVESCEFNGNGDSHSAGLLPIYYSDNTSRMPDYRYDSENDEAYYLGDIDSSSVTNESIRVSLNVENVDSYIAESGSICEFTALLSLSGGIQICAEVCDYENDVQNTFDSNGNLLTDVKYFLCDIIELYDDNLEKLKNSELAIIKEGDFEQITEFITSDLHIVNSSYLPDGATLITGSSCKVLVLCCNIEFGYRGNWNIVISPSLVKILNENLDSCDSLETRNIKLFISNKMRVDTLLDFVKTFTFRTDFDGRSAIGFSEFNGDDNYKPKLNKCLEITNIIESNDTSHRLFNDIEYLVDNLNQIGFNIELY